MAIQADISLHRMDGATGKRGFGSEGVRKGAKRA
jgi:hypothetical protein